MKLGKLIATVRDVQGLTQRQLQHKSGIPHATLAQIESGYVKEPSWRNVVKIARALNINLNVLADCE